MEGTEIWFRPPPPTYCIEDVDVYLSSKIFWPKYLNWHLKKGVSSSRLHQNYKEKNCSFTEYVSTYGFIVI